MPIAVVLESTWQASALAPWAARLAAARGDKSVLFLATSAAKGRKKAEARRAAKKAEKKKPVVQAAKEKVSEAVEKVADAVEQAVDAAENGGDADAGPGPGDAAEPPSESPLEAAAREAVAASGFGGEGGVKVEFRAVEVAPPDGDADPGAGLEDLLGLLEEHGTDLVLLAAGETARRDDPLATRLFRAVRCSVVVLRPPPSRKPGQGDTPGTPGNPDAPGNPGTPGKPAPGPADAGGRILVPTAGGPHAALALRLAAGLERPPGSTPSGRFSGVDAFYVQKDVGPESRGLAQRKLRASVRKALAGPLGVGTGAEAGVGEIIRVGVPYQKALASVVSQGRHGVVLVGAADRVQAKRVLFSGLPDDLLRDAGENDRGVTLAVVREAEALSATAGRKLRGWVARWVPQLDREDRISLVERIEGPSQWSFDFVALMILSTAIATFGEMQNSTAVVIGAMLVAPLMTPLVGCGLAVVQGNNRLVRGSVHSVAFGFLVSFAVALGMGLLIPFPGLTEEVLARGRPTLLDLGVAFVSGLAAAYAVARPNLSGALPGVAIAAALVPPIAAAGLAFSAGDWWVGGGATLLFTVNVLAIILGAAIALLAVGVESRHEHKRGGVWRPHAFGFLGIGCAVLAVPLTWLLLQQMPPEGVPLDVQQDLDALVAERDTGELVRVEGPYAEGDAMRVEVLRRGTAPPRDTLADELAARLADHYRGEVRVNLRTELAQRSGQSATAE